MGFLDRGAVEREDFFFAPALEALDFFGEAADFFATDFALAFDFGFAFGLGFGFAFGLAFGLDFGLAFGLDLAFGREGRALFRAPEERLAVFFFAFFLLAIRLNTDSR